MSLVRVYHVFAREKYATDLLGGAITCTPFDWRPYSPNSVVFVFADKSEAVAYAGTRADEVLILCVDVEPSSIEPDQSSPRSAAENFLASFPDEAHLLAHVSEPVAWKSALAHFGPIPISVATEELDVSSLS